MSEELSAKITLISETQPDLFLTITEVLKLVSAKRGSSSKLTLKLHEIKEQAYDDLMSGNQEANLSFACNLKVEKKLTPIGAEVLRELIHDGTITLKHPDVGLNKLESYIHSLDEKYEQACRIRDEEEAEKNSKKERLELLCQNPDELTLEEMSDCNFLDQFFKKKFGKGSHAVQVRNFMIKKLLHDGTYKSNSGKTRMGRFTPYFEITNTFNGDVQRINYDQVLLEIEAKPINRRNDPNQNWGAGRE